MKKQNEKPNKIYFELTNACNFNCDFCPITISSRRTHFMDFSLYTKGIDDIVRSKITDTIGFHVLGEPLLYPQIFQALEYAKKHSLRIELTTNGSLLTEECVRNLIRCKLDKLSISLETSIAMDHESRGSQTRFEEYFQQVLNAVRIIHREDANLKLEISMMNPISGKYFDIDRDLKITAKNEAYREKLLSLIRDLLPVLSPPPNKRAVESQIRALQLNKPLIIRIDDHTAIYIQMLGDWGNAFAARKIYPSKIGFCGYALKNIGILNNGEVTICCVDYDGKTSLGNLNDSDLASILMSERACLIRNGFKRLRLVDPHCQRCIGSTHPLKTAVKSLVSIYLFKVLRFKPDYETEICLPS
jgi:MoaA/NifB/PqqE/SkfB family radical SAM enzyme